MDPMFLTLAEVLEINLDQVRQYGGTASVRDEGVLIAESRSRHRNRREK